MIFLTNDLVHRPTSEQQRWLANAIPLLVAMRAWADTLLLGCAVFFCLRIAQVGPIRSLMVAILVLTAVATSIAPRIGQSICAHAALRLRAGPAQYLDVQGRRFKRVASGYVVSCLGLWCVVGAYNLLSLSILLTWSGQPLERYFSQWPVLTIWLLFGGWTALVFGEHWLLRSLKS